MKVIRPPERFRLACEQARSSGRRVALVPTMGALHDGHLALVRQAVAHADFVAVSIFVNPTQFGPTEDLAKYPRTFEQDAALCADAGVSVVFAPEEADVYPEGEQTRVRVAAITSALCGAHRPNHFEGVATVVTKLLALTGPCAAIFGRKDYQQLQVIRRLVRDLFLPVEIIGVRTVRESDGLALSSRNRYLDAPTRERALAIPRGLGRAAAAFAAGEHRVSALRAAAAEPITAAADSVDYVEVADADSVEPLSESASVVTRALLAVAARFGATRLIDNIVLGEDPAPC